MQIVKVKTATVLAASGEEQMRLSTDTTTTLDASEIFGGSDDSEDW